MFCRCGVSIKRSPTVTRAAAAMVNFMGIGIKGLKLNFVTLSCIADLIIWKLFNTVQISDCENSLIG